MVYIICIMLALGIVLEVIYIQKNNRKILIRGRCDLFMGICILGGAQLLFPVTEQISTIIMTRNILLMIMVLLFMGLRSGFSNTGVEKNGCTMPWSQLEKVEFKETELSWITVTCENKHKKFTVTVKKTCLDQLCTMFREHASMERMPCNNWK